MLKFTIRVSHSTILLTVLFGIATRTSCAHGPIDQPGRLFNYEFAGH